MSDATTPVAGDTAANGHDADMSNGTSSNNADFDAKLNRAITNHIGRLEKRLSEQFGRSLAEHIDKLTAKPSEEAIAPAEEAKTAGERTTLKALEGKVLQLQSQVQSSEKARKEAEQRAVDVKVRGQVQQLMSKYLGADSPHIGPLMDSLYDVKKRFVATEAGEPVVKFKRDWGDQDVPLDAGIKEMFDTELKHLVPAKNAGLPPLGPQSYVPASLRPQPYPQTPQGVRLNPILAEIAAGIAEHRPEVGQRLMQAAIMPDKK